MRARGAGVLRAVGTAALAVAVLGGAAACGAVPVAPNAPGRSASPALAGPVAAADNQLGFGLLQQLTAGGRTGNVFISPPSLAIDLSMLYNGARGDTAAQMAHVLHVQGLGMAAVNGGNAALLAALTAPGGGVTLDIANSLWANAGVALLPAFLQTNALYYNAKLATVDFRNPGTAGEINGWVDQHTAGKIPTLVGQLPANGVLMLLNAVYFQGKWQTAFTAADTRPGTFTDRGGRAESLPMMSRTGPIAYAQVPAGQLASLPYAGGRFSMEILLPGPGGGLPTDIATAWAGWQAQLQPHQVALTLPRFTIRDTDQLAAPLGALGMADAFTAQADFSGLCPAGCDVSSVVQKTFLQVDETGTTAAAATSIGITATAVALPPQAIPMDVDRPFFCAIVDHQTGAVLFLGDIQALNA